MKMKKKKEDENQNENEEKKEDDNNNNNNNEDNIKEKNNSKLFSAKYCNILIACNDVRQFPYLLFMGKIYY